MLKLGGKVIEIKIQDKHTSRLYKVSINDQLPLVLAKEQAFLIKSDFIPSGYAHYLIPDRLQHLINTLPIDTEYTVLPNDYHYLDSDDVISIDPHSKSIRVLFRSNSSQNSILVTEQCNHYCLMCSQPPKKIDDSWILEEIKQLIPLIPRSTKEIGFTGGEPTIFKHRFLDVLKLAKSYLPNTAVHILSNGRSFKDLKFAREYACIEHPDMMIGIPIYSDDPSHHDYIVQAKGAFDETIQGILNLKRLNQKVEIRIVLHKESISRLIPLAEFIGRNLLFVDHVALMGLEMMGFTRANLDTLWIDPYEYKDTLSEATRILATYGLNVSIYNHQLCLVNQDILPFYRKSISDWKNEYADECIGCSKLSECGGFFSSGIKHGYSSHLKKFPSTTTI